METNISIWKKNNWIWRLNQGKSTERERSRSRKAKLGEAIDDEGTKTKAIKHQTTSANTKSTNNQRAERCPVREPKKKKKKKIIISAPAGPQQQRNGSWREWWHNAESSSQQTRAHKRIAWTQLFFFLGWSFERQRSTMQKATNEEKRRFLWVWGHAIAIVYDIFRWKKKKKKQTAHKRIAQDQSRRARSARSMHATRRRWSDLFANFLISRYILIKSPRWIGRSFQQFCCVIVCFTARPLQAHYSQKIAQFPKQFDAYIS